MIELGRCVCPANFIEKLQLSNWALTVLFPPASPTFVHLLSLSWVICFCRACFDELQVRNMLVWLVLDYICDGVYILDIAVRLHTGTERAMRLTFF